MSAKSVNINKPVEIVKNIIITGGIKQTSQVKFVKWINWKVNSNNHLIGKIPYLRSKNLSTVKFHIYLQSVQNRTLVTVQVEPTSFFYKNKWIVYVLGLMMCGVGIIFPLIGFSLTDQRINKAAIDLCNSLARINK